MSMHQVRSKSCSQAPRMISIMRHRRRVWKCYLKHGFHWLNCILAEFHDPLAYGSATRNSKELSGVYMDIVKQFTKGRVVHLIEWLIANYDPLCEEIFKFLLVPGYLYMALSVLWISWNKWLHCSLPLKSTLNCPWQCRNLQRLEVVCDLLFGDDARCLCNHNFKWCW